MSRLNDFLNEFNGTSAGHAAAILLILLTGVIVAGRLAMGKPFPEGYDAWLVTLVTLAGVNAAAMGVKRLTDFRYKAAGTSPVTVGGPSTVNVTAEAAPAAGGGTASPAPAQPDPDTKGDQ